MSGRREGGVLCLLTLASLFALGAIVTIGLAVGTEHWQDITVGRDEVKAFVDLYNTPENNEMLYYDHTWFTRYRGVFRTCVYDTEAKFFNKAEELGLMVLDYTCIWDDGITMPGVKERENWGKDNVIRDHLVRLQLGVLALALFLLLLGVLVAACSCIEAQAKHMMFSAALTFLAGISGAVGMGVFHGILMLENKINQKPFAAWYMSVLPTKRYTAVEFGYSYIVGWVGSGCGLIAAMLFMTAGMRERFLSRERRPPLIPTSKTPSLMNLPQPRMLPMMPPPMMLSAPPITSLARGGNGYSFHQSQGPAYPTGYNFDGADADVMWAEIRS